MDISAIFSMFFIYIPVSTISFRIMKLVISLIQSFYYKISEIMNMPESHRSPGPRNLIVVKWSWT